jgi:hypothetical protein
MSKTYLDGKVILKEPTVEGLCKVGEILRVYDYSSLVCGQGLLDLLPVICDIDKSFDYKKDLPRDTVKEILKDFFTIWNPMEWTSGNIAIMEPSLKRLRELQTPRDSKKPSK